MDQKQQIFIRALKAAPPPLPSHRVSSDLEGVEGVASMARMHCLRVV